MFKLNFQAGSVKALVILVSRVLTALVGIIFIPIYVRLIGAESYGLVAFFGTLAGSLTILDLGLSTAISRQIAILRAKDGEAKSMRDLVFSVEIIYWAIALLVGLLIVALAHPISEYWVNAKDLPKATIEKAVMLMGVVFAFQFPSSIYNGVMIGMERQISNALLTLLFSAAKAGGVILVLQHINSSIETYFIWQAAITLIFTLVLRLFVWKWMASAKVKASFSRQQLRSIFRFAAGMTGLSLITFFLAQIDKIVVSKMVLLEFVGYYNLAFMVSGGINQIISPMQPVIFPKFASLLIANKKEELLQLYHKSCRWVSIIVFPIGFTLIFFAKEILLLWTKNPVLTEHTAPILKVFAAGTICNCMVWIPYFYLLAKGNTRFSIYQNIIAAIFLVPLLFWWTSKYGALGASYVWLSVNAGYVLITIPLFHKLYLPGELMRWYKKDVALPLVASVVLIVGAKYFQMQLMPQIDWKYFGMIMLVLCGLYGLIIPEMRGFAKRLKLRFKS